MAYTRGLKSSGEMSQYQSALKVTPPTKEEEAQLADLELKANSNMTLCCLKIPGRAVDALQHADAVLVADPGNGKALFNKGRALLLLNDLDAAQGCLAAAAAASPEDSAVKKELAKLPALRAMQDAKEKTTWQAAFKKM